MPRFVPRRAPAWLIAGGILLTWLAAALIVPDSTNIWIIGLVVALCVGVPNAGLVWFFRQQARLVREAAIAEVREMMADRVKNPLAVIGMCTHLTQEGDSCKFAIEDINGSVNQITQAVDGLSSDSLGSWKAQYHESLNNRAFLP